MSENGKQLKPGWKWVKFGDVVQLSKERCKDPIAEGYERFVGLEHLEPADLKIRSWGDTADGITFTSVFKPGQVLFGKRRAYQRKTAVADFSGVCSGDIYVFESKNSESLLPKLLPFICQMEAFFNHAVGTSAGSLSPRTNWTSLASYEFAFPPIDEQIKFQDLLIAIEENYDQLLAAEELATKARISFIEEKLQEFAEAYPTNELGVAIQDINYGCSSKSSYESNGVPILRIPNVLRGEIDNADLQWIQLSDKELSRYTLSNGDVLIVRTNGNPEYVGRAVCVDKLDRATVFASYLIRIRCKQDLLNPFFLAEFLNAPSVRQKLRGEVKSSAGNFNINTQGIKKQPFPIPSIADQETVLQSLEEFDSTLAALSKRIDKIKQFKQCVLTRINENDV